MANLAQSHCVPCEGGTSPLEPKAVADYLKQLEAWQLIKEDKEIAKRFSFKNYYHTMAFVNAIAWIAHQENHHPDLEVGYNYCLVRYSTHAIGGLSENDFICAAKVDALFVTSKVCSLPGK